MGKQRGKLGAITFSRATMGAVALFVLMGAKGDGCLGGGGPGEDDDPNTQPPPVEPCPPGHHLELVCDDHGCDDDVPYPGDPGDPGEPPPDWEGDPEPAWGGTSGGGAGEPMTTYPPEPPGECVEICVPDEVCPEGTYEEIVCEGWGYGPEPTTPCLDPNGCQEPPPPPGEEECYSTCVPIDICPPGEVEVWVCDEGDGQGGYGQGICLDPQGCQEPPPPEPGECYPICMPQECPPGTQLDLVCDPYGCWEECVGYPNECPPGTYPDFECDGYGNCNEICWPIDAPCPPGFIPDVQCDQYGCYEICLEPEMP